jgi:spermidine synthase
MKPYLLIPLCAVVWSLYFYTWFAVRTGMIAGPFHRRLWNIILLVTFLAAAALGIIQAVLINYKIETTYVKEILVYHVNFGISMSLVALFHLWRHLPYYFPALNRKKYNGEIPATVQSGSALWQPKQVKILLLVLGLSASMIQVIFLRLFLSIFYGNELITGIFLAVWMSLTGLGSWLGKNPDFGLQGAAKKFVIILSCSFFAAIAGMLMALTKSFFVPAGVLINVWQLMLIMVFFLMPVCICSGYAFKSLASVQTGEGAGNYAAETAGSIIGGILITFSVLLFLEPLQTLSFVLALNIIVAAILFAERRVTRYAVILIALAIPVFFTIYRIDIKSKALLFTNQEILESRDTPYGSLTITQGGGQKNLFSGMKLQYTGSDVEHNEETAHFPGLQHAFPVKVLLVSSGYLGIVPEILKYPSVKEIVHIEPNPWFTGYAEKYFPPLPDKKIRTIRKDPRRFLLSDTTHYDLIIMDVPEPSTIQSNRYYSLEFIQLLKRHSNKSTVVSYGMGSSINYMSKENIRLSSILYNTFRRVFSNVLIVPGNSNYMLAGDGPLSLDYQALFNAKNIETLYVNPSYLDNRSLMQRSSYILGTLDKEAPLNTDLAPAALWAQTLNFFSLLNVNWVVLMSIMTLLLLLPLFRLNLVSYSVYITGFTASSLEILILFTFQFIFGYLYAAAGFIFAVFMGGLSLGARQQKKWGDSSLFKIQFWVTITAVAVSGLIFLLPKISCLFLLFPIIGIITFIPAYLTGHQFALALIKLPGVNDNKTGYLYGVDLLGSALGLMIISVVCIPVLGYAASVLILISVNLISALILYFSKK